MSEGLTADKKLVRNSPEIGVLAEDLRRLTSISKILGESCEKHWINIHWSDNGLKCAVSRGDLILG